MIDAVITSVVGLSVGGFVSITLFRLNIRKREEIMLLMEYFQRRICELRTLLETDKRYRPKDAEMVAAVNSLESEFYAVYRSMRWPWYSRRKREEVFRAYQLFRSSFDAFVWVDCNQAGPINRAKSAELSRMLGELIFAMR